MSEQVTDVEIMSALIILSDLCDRTYTDELVGHDFINSLSYAEKDIVWVGLRVLKDKIFGDD